jgi:hypothetical protein
LQLAGSKECVSRDLGRQESDLHRIDRGLITARWAPRKATAAIAILTLGCWMLRPGGRGVNTKPSPKFFVKFESCAADFRQQVPRFAPAPALL